MELSNDQKAILRLLAQRGAAGYDDLTALMGMSAVEVHAKAKAAAAQLEADGIPAPSIPAPGDSVPTSSAEPPVAAPPPEPAAPPPEAPAPPAAVDAPPAPTAPTSPQPPRKDAPKPPGSRPKLTLPSSGGARAAIAAGALVLVALIVVLIAGSGDSGETTTATSEGAAGAAEEAADTTATGGKEITQAILEPVDGGDAKGVAAFGRVKNSLALQIEASGLQPTAKGQSYAVWLYESPQKMLPLATTPVDESGKIAAQVEVPTEVLAYLANETFDQIDISLTSTATLKAALAKATREKKAPAYTGTDVLRGEIIGPIVGAAKK